MDQRLNLQRAPMCTRRQLLLTVSVLIGGCAEAPRTPSAVLASQPSMDDFHLVNRLTWGANDAELARFRAVGRSEWLKQQLAGKGGPSMPAAIQARIDELSISRRSLLDMAGGLRELRQKANSLSNEDERKAARQQLNEGMNQWAHEAATRHVLRALYSPHQLKERLTWFWFNHFNVFQHKHEIRAMLGDYEEQALRPHALGQFRQLLGAVIHHPAMLRYLDNDQNTVGKANENLARELMELHTLGVDAGYTQKDVQELARVLTGHGDRQSGQESQYGFNPARHDFGAKVFMGHAIRARGVGELDEALDILAHHPATARFISRKLARTFCSDQPSDSMLDHMSAAFGQSHGHIGRTLEAMIGHADFKRSSGTHFKDPVHYVFSAVRAAYDDRPILNTRQVENWLNRLGEGLYNRQTPDGYAMGPQAWSSSGQMSTRFEIARAIGTVKDPSTFPQLARPIYYQYTRSLLSADTRQALDKADSPQEWNTLYLCAPEFMYT